MLFEGGAAAQAFRKAHLFAAKDVRRCAGGGLNGAFGFLYGAAFVFGT